MGASNLPVAYLNGVYLPLDEARISPLDRGFLFGDGVYEVIPCYGGRLFRLEPHIGRLERSLREIHLTNPLSHAEWLAVLTGLVERNGGGHQTLYLQVTRGAATTRDQRFPDNCPATVFAFATRQEHPDAHRHRKPAHAALPATTPAGPAAISKPSPCWPIYCCDRRHSWREPTKPF